MYNFYVVMEYAKGGKLFDKLQMIEDHNENLAAEIIRQVLSTMVYLHSKNYVFQCLSPSVLFLEKDDQNQLKQGNFNVKLSNLDLISAIA